MTKVSDKTLLKGLIVKRSKNYDCWQKPTTPTLASKIFTKCVKPHWLKFFSRRRKKTQH